MSRRDEGGIEGLRYILENVIPFDHGMTATERKKVGTQKAEITLKIGVEETSIGINIERDGKMQHMLGVARHVSTTRSGSWISIDDLADALLADIAGQGIKLAADKKAPPKKTGGRR